MIGPHEGRGENPNWTKAKLDAQVIIMRVFNDYGRRMYLARAEPDAILHAILEREIADALFRVHNGTGLIHLCGRTKLEVSK